MPQGAVAAAAGGLAQAEFGDQILGGREGYARFIETKAWRRCRRGALLSVGGLRGGGAVALGTVGAEQSGVP